MKASRHAFAASARYAPHYPARCEQAVDEALQATAAYQDWHTADPGPASGVFSRLASLATVTKQELRRHGPQGFVPHGRCIDEALATGEIELVATSGTTGDQVTNVWYQPWWNASEAASWKLNAHAAGIAPGEHREAILTSPWCTGFPCEEGFLTREQRTSGRFLYLTERSNPATWPSSLLDRMVEELNQFKPLVLEANPSFLARLARHISRKALRVQAPGLIILSYENPSHLHYRQIRRVFESPIASSYGSTEAGYVFMECEAGRLHQVAESCHVDFLPFTPAQGGPDIGRILVTTFDNPWRSLVRFDIGDIVRLDDKTPCPCGRHEGLTLASIEGRMTNLTLTPGGRAVTQGAVDRALTEVPGLEAYEWRQTGHATYTLRLVHDDSQGPRASTRAREALEPLYGHEADITVEVVEAIAPDPPGKYNLSKSMFPMALPPLLDGRFAPAW